MACGDNLGMFGFDENGRMGPLALSSGHSYEEVLDLTGWRISPLIEKVPHLPPVQPEEEAELVALRSTLAKGGQK